MDSEARTRLRWVELYHETGDAGLTCRRCGISRPTLRKWLRRYEAHGVEGLCRRSRRPHSSPARKRSEDVEALILGLRRRRRLGARRLQHELARLHEIRLSLATIQKALQQHGIKPLSRKRTFPKVVTRYTRPTPGDRVQMDVCKIAPGRYQYTAIDDCTRYKVLALFPRRTAANSLRFLDKVIEEMPVPIQRLQTDRGREFFAEAFQRRLMELCIKFRPIKPRSPHLNGKVERSQRTDLDEFYGSVDLKDPALEERLQAWQHHYNWERPHGSLHGKTPMDRLCELLDQTPLSEDVAAAYDLAKERIQEQNYVVDLALRAVHRNENR
jgi:transposase InsO family protein